MNKIFVFIFFFVSFFQCFSQGVMTPELMWKLGRVEGETISADGNDVIYGVTYYDMAANKGERNLYSIPITGGDAKQITTALENESGVQTTPSGKLGYLYKGQWWEANWDGTAAKQITNIEGNIDNVKFTSDGKYVLYTKEVKVFTDYHDRYPDLPKANAHGADDLMYRHWNEWEDGRYSHIFYASYYNGKFSDDKDIMQGEPYDCPQKPDGGPEDVIWDGLGQGIIYVCKKKTGKDYAQSTNTDLYYYSIATGKTTDLTLEGKGYDTHPVISPKGTWIAYASMAQEGFEADKNDLIVGNLLSGKRINFTKDWDGTIQSVRWSNDGTKIYFLAVTNGTEQIFEVSLQQDYSKNSVKDIHQLTKGDHNITDLIGEASSAIIASMQDMNHAAELVSINTSTGEIIQVTHVNKPIYDGIRLSRIDKVWISTTDNKKMLTWVIYPPEYDAAKKYPALLYCQGGPQSALSQFYSYRWNFQVMAAKGYIVIAPGRRGMPGFGAEWNASISGDWGGQPIRDYLSAVDSVSKWPSVDKSRIGAVGASYGGYSIYMLEAMGNGRFKSCIAHCGLFDLESWYGTTEELWFANWDLGGPYWNVPLPKSFINSNPIKFVDKWSTPIMIIEGERDYRVPYTQGLEAFQVVQLKGIKSRLLVFPDETHYVLQPQNSLLWHREFYRWLDETLKQ